MNAPRTRLILISGAIVLFVLLFISPRHNGGLQGAETRERLIPKKNAFSVTKRSSLKVYLDLATKTLAPEQITAYETLQKKGNTDSLVVFWNRLKRPDLAAWHAEAFAEVTDSAAHWHQAGNRYYYAVPFTRDESEIPLLYQRAMFCYDKSFKKNPSLNDARIMFAACMVESGSDPMQGISLLREVEKTDSTNIKLQMTFAQFSLKSGQLEKAISRFHKILSIDSTYSEVYLHLADTYEKLDRKDMSLKMLEKYQSKSSDPTVKLEVGKYIEQLRNSN